MTGLNSFFIIQNYLIADFNIDGLLDLLVITNTSSSNTTDPFMTVWNLYVQQNCSLSSCNFNQNTTIPFNQIIPQPVIMNLLSTPE